MRHSFQVPTTVPAISKTKKPKTFDGGLPGQFTVAVGNVFSFFVFRQSIDDVAQSGQRFVDHLGFFQRLSLGPRFGNHFTPGQIHQTQLALLRAAGRGVLLVNANDRHRMGPG